MKYVSKLVIKTLRKLGFDLIKYRPNGRDSFDDLMFFLDGLRQPQVFDVGANVGQSVKAFKNKFPEALINSFEPASGAFQELERVAAGYLGVTCWKLGVGAKAGELSLVENTESVMSSFLEPGKLAWGDVKSRTLVPVVCLDDFCQERGIESIDVLKCDTQGFELEVFRGASQMMSKNQIKLILCELTISRMYQGQPYFDEILKFLRDNGFELVTFYDFYYQQRIVSWTDGLFVNKKFLDEVLAARA